MPQWQLGYRQLRLILKMSRLLHFSVFGESEHNGMATWRLQPTAMLPAVVRVRGLVISSNLIAFPINDENHAD
jgi:hypothetical protein